jgi:hypothetical protein
MIPFLLTVPDALAWLQHSSSTPLQNIYAWAFISNRPDALYPDEHQGVLPPSAYTMHTVVRSWVHNDDLSESAVLVSELSSHRFSVYGLSFYRGAFSDSVRLNSCIMNHDRPSLSILPFTYGQLRADFISKTPPPSFGGQTRSFPTPLATKGVI